MPQQKLDGLMKWVARPEWAAELAEVAREHLEPACEETGVDFDELEEVLAPAQMAMLSSCVLEDFITRMREEDGRNVVDDYLKRRGWKESVTTKRYLHALRDSEMSLYEVGQVVPRQSFVARDLLRGGPSVLVSDNNVSGMLQNGDRIATRIIELNGKRIVSAGLLAFDHAMSEELLEVFEAAKDEMPDLVRDLTDEDGAPLDEVEQRKVLGLMTTTLAPTLVSTVWLESRLDGILGETMPETVTSEGDDVEYHEMRFPLLAGASVEAVRERLDGIAALDPEPSGDFWAWVAPRPAADDGALDGEEVLGSIGLDETGVTFMTDSAARAARGGALLTPALDGLVGVPSTTIRALQQAMDERSAGAPPHESKIRPEVQAEVLHSALEQYYRGLLGQPIPMLGNVSPREAALTAAGRVKLVAWLRELEGGTASHRDAGNPLGTYDFGWIWAELGVEALRT